MLVLLLLFLVALVAGFIDAIAGGGGLLTLPALILAGVQPSQALGTNKGQSVFGSGLALVRFAHSPLLDRRRVLFSFPPALLAAAGGAYLVQQVPPPSLKPLIMCLLAGVAVFMVFYRPPHVTPEPRHRPKTAVAIALVIAAYDGFFGPGTGSFLILAYVLLVHDTLHAASANAKVVNFASNLGSLAVFALCGKVVWSYALPMACGQALGGFLGAHATIRIGRPLVRYATLLVSLGLLGKLGWDVYQAGAVR